MNVHVLKSKIHRATVQQAALNYVGSITIDSALLKAANIYEYEQVQIVNIDNGARFTTYTIAGEKDSGMICLNGAAARCVQPGDKIIIMAYCELNNSEVTIHKPQVVFVDNNNKISKISHYEKHGQLS